MLTFSSYVILRATAILSALAALIPALYVKGREFDPLRDAVWWTAGYHSAVLVVSSATALGVLLYFLLANRGLWKWWIFALAGVAVALSPAIFYAFATPAVDKPTVPFDLMVATGIPWGAICGSIVFALLKSHLRSKGA